MMGVARDPKTWGEDFRRENLVNFPIESSKKPSSPGVLAKRVFWTPTAPLVGTPTVSPGSAMLKEAMATHTAVIMADVREEIRMGLAPLIAELARLSNIVGERAGDDRQDADVRGVLASIVADSRVLAKAKEVFGPSVVLSIDDANHDGPIITVRNDLPLDQLSRAFLVLERWIAEESGLPGAASIRLGIDPL